MSAMPLAQLEQWLEVLARRWERYFTHDPQVPLPPEHERVALERQLREVSRAEGRSTSDQFRLEQILHRFATFNQLWQRQLRAREEARQAVRPGGGHVLAPASVSTPEGDGLEEVFGRYRAALAQAGRGEPGVSADAFRTALAAQRTQLEAKGAVVDGFDVVVEGASVKVRARVLRRRTE